MRKKLISTVVTANLLATSIFSSLSCSPFTTQKALAAEEKTTDESVTDLKKYNSNEIIVAYKKDSNATKKKTLRIASLSKAEEKEASVDTLTDNSVILRLDSKDTLKDALAALSTDSSVAYVQPNYTYYATSESSDTLSLVNSLQNNPGYSKQWGLHNDGTLHYEEVDYRNQNNGNNGWTWPFSNYSIKTQASTSSNTLEVQAKSGVDINYPEALSACKGKGNRKTIVAIVDTGVMYDHEDLKDNMWVNEKETADNGIDDDGNGYIDDIYGWNFYGNGGFSWFGSDSESGSSTSSWGYPGSDSSSNGNNTYYNKKSATEDSHGTHGAGTIAALNNSTGVVGIASNANVEIMTVKALGGSMGYGSTENVVKGIQYAIDNGATIINLSLGGEEDDPTLKNIIANNPNVLFTVAAGNGDSSYNGVDNDSTPTYPACYTYDNLLSVANIQCDGTLHYSSNYGAKTVQLAAPGSCIYSTSTENDSDTTSNTKNSSAKSGYETMTGTSMAAPMVAGVAAMLYSKYDSYSILDIKNAILNSVTKMDSLTDKVSTGGMLNAYGAVELLQNGSISASTPVPTATTMATPTATVKPTNKPTATPRATATPKSTATPSVAPSQTPVFSSKPTATATATATPDASTTPKATATPTASTLPTTKAPVATTTPEVKPTTAPTATATIVPTPTATVSPLKIDRIGITGTSINIGKKYSIITNVSGGSSNYTYDFYFSQNNSVTEKSSKTGIVSWTPKKSGTCLILVYVTDENGNTTHNYITCKVNPLKVTKLAKNKTLKTGRTIKFTAKVNAGIAPITYTYSLYRNGKCFSKLTTKSTSVYYKVRKKGTYKLTVVAKDANGNKATKSITQKVTK